MTYHHGMARAKITITVDEHAPADTDQLVADRTNPHRSKLALECAKLDPAEEKALAEEGYVAKRPSVD
jgi:hypothetical protein